MAKFTELPVKVQLLTVAGLVIGLTLAAYYFLYQPMTTENQKAALELKKVQDQNDLLKQFEPKLADMNRQIDSLREQLNEMKKIVPDDKQADQFIEMIQETAQKSGVYVRRYTARNVSTREFYSEAPYELELDGPYYSMLNFFDSVGKLERIVNVSGLKVATRGSPGSAGGRGGYAYKPNETVVATCTTTTFFSKDIQPAGKK
jgi:type IV pilus assembly protein PilO